MDWRQHIERDPAVLGGKPKIRGTRISVELVLGRLGEGWSEEQLLEAYPHIAREQVHACLSYAAEVLSSDEVVDVPRPAA